jgi:hypothetical protein
MKPHTEEYLKENIRRERNFVSSSGRASGEFQPVCVCRDRISNNSCKTVLSCFYCFYRAILDSHRESLVPLDAESTSENCPEVYHCLHCIVKNFKICVWKKLNVESVVATPDGSMDRGGTKFYKVDRHGLSFAYTLPRCSYSCH